MDRVMDYTREAGPPSFGAIGCIKLKCMYFIVLSAINIG